MEEEKAQSTPPRPLAMEKVKGQRLDDLSSWRRLFTLTCVVWLGFIAHVSTGALQVLLWVWTIDRLLLYPQGGGHSGLNRYPLPNDHLE